MVTRTRPRPAARTHFAEVSLRKADRLLVAESLGIHPKKEASKLDAAVESLELLLSRAKFRLHLVKVHPLPANIVAELRPIAESAAVLRDALNLTRMSPAAWTELTLDSNDLVNVHDAVAELHERASQAIERLSGKKNKGKDVQEFSDSLASVNVATERIFDKYFADELDGSARELALDEFLAVCRKYLPAPPNRRKAKKGVGEN